MEILSVTGCPYEDYDGQILNLRIQLESGESVHVGETISIEMMDDTFMDAEVKIINPKYAGDFAWVSKKAADRVEAGEYGMSKKRVMHAEGPCIATVVVLDVPYHEVKTEEEINARKAIEEMQRMICLSPFKELDCGDKSIHDFVQEGYTVPDRVIAYLRTTKPYAMCPGIYEHPFKPGKELLGPYMYTDGKHYWDRDMWKYVVKYHVTLPQEFIDYVMSDEGAAFIEDFIDQSDSWPNVIKNWKKQQGSLCLLPDNAGDIEIEEF